MENLNDKVINKLDTRILELVSMGILDEEQQQELDTYIRARDSYDQYVSNKRDIVVDVTGEIKDIVKALLSAGVSVYCLAMILRYEDENVITTKGFSIVQRMIPFK